MNKLNFEKNDQKKLFLVDFLLAEISNKKMHEINDFLDSFLFKPGNGNLIRFRWNC